MSPFAQARAGAHLVRTGAPHEALSHLQRTVSHDSTLILPEYGAATYWLGEAYARMDSSAAAQSVWDDGMEALRAAGRFDVRLADAYLRTLSPSRLRTERLAVVDDYSSLLERVGNETSAAADSILRRRVAQLEPLLPDDVFAQVVEEDRETEPTDWTFRPDAGDALAAWWRGLDPFPATPENERLEEHVTRLVRAGNAFRCDDPKPDVLDDRGTVHLRLGAPYKRRPLRHEDGEFFQEVYRFGVPVPASGFPDGELWVYPQIDENTYYLFVEEEGSDCYRIAQANELLPSTLRQTRGNSDRGLNIAYSSLMAMRSIYEELALYHIDYSGRYSQIANYADYQEMQATAAKLGASGGTSRQRTVGAGVGQTRVVTSNPAFGIPNPTEFVRRLVSRAEREDERAARRRKEETPRQYTTLREGAPTLPVAVRTARSLTEEGQTQTDVYWGVSTAAVALPNEGDTSAPSTIRISAVQSDANHTVEERLSEYHRVDSAYAENEAALIPAPVTFTNPAANPYHLRLRWVQYRRWEDEARRVSSLGPKRRVAFARADSLRPLRANGPLEMSDLKVLRLPDTTAASLAAPLERGQLYPFRSITADTPLVLAFELYHLSFEDDDRTRYTLSYEVEGQTKRGWTRLFRGQDTQRTETETTVEGSDRRTEETILLDLSEIDRGEAQDIRVTVRATDEVTGHTRSRTVDFVLDPDE